MANQPEGTPPQSGLNPRLQQGVDSEYSDEVHGSTPMDTVSVKNSGPAVWPVIWAVVTIGLVLLTLWLIFG
ncbi:MAG: hypothetical protein WCY15_12445 [Phenylobacterium sp.]|jgi:hypothetical protein|uniref:hypothetical protein n=1 Tax=Phenylobacterium sp. TaxID=1871053 RepID=UPI002A2CE653|nr:hypothetical protein [Phenylobacterium sp.]MDD3836771.1 hypothetical protein [Phenylobacterium sp.]MDX9996347.1 hypothetical protein [Phenylobacterium sp.]